MTEQHLHIICLQTPWPPDFGGVMDLFYKLKYLNAAGVKIHLHCFTTTTEKPTELERYCEEVHYYQRNKTVTAFSFYLPFIVSSRISKELEKKLQQDNYPVLFEGIHTTHLLYKNKLEGRPLFVRLHNVEFEYYKHLAAYETGIFKKFYFTYESSLLRKYEEAVAGKAFFITVNKKDIDRYKEICASVRASFLPVFIPCTKITVTPGTGSYCLYHGNLAINENEEAVMWLLQHVFAKNNIAFTIAGKNPSAKLKKATAGYKNCTLIPNPSETEMHELISGAQISILPSFNNTGVKLKLINAVCNGRHCLVNKAGAEGSGLEAVCETAETADEFINMIEDLMPKEVTNENIQQRISLLDELYNNNKNAATLVKWLCLHYQ